MVHPAHGADFEIDNEDSLVVGLGFSGRRILLTGDVEGVGQTELFQATSGPFDVLLAPHHGGRESNTVDLSLWAQPAVVISSCGRSSAPFLKTIYPDSAIYETFVDGAVTVEISPDGDLAVERFRKAGP